MNGKSLEGKTVVISGSRQRGHLRQPRRPPSWARKVVAMSDSNGYVYDENGIDLEVVKEIKEVERGRIKDYAERVPGAEYHRGLQRHLDHSLRCGSALRHPERAGCATDAKALVANGVHGSVRRAPTCPPPRRPLSCFQENGVLFAPAKAANAGGVATSAAWR